MAIQMKDTASIARKFVQRAQAAGSEYKSGVDNPSVDWATATAAAAPAYVEGVQAAVGRNAYQKGVQAAGSAKWQAKASVLGSARYGQGVAASESAYSQGADKYFNVLKGVSLPPRAAKGSPQNIARVQAVADALHRAKTGS